MSATSDAATRLVVIIDLELGLASIESIPVDGVLPWLALEFPLIAIEDPQRRRVATALQKHVRRLAKVAHKHSLGSGSFDTAFYVLRRDLPKIVSKALHLGIAKKDRSLSEGVDQSV